MQEIIKKRETKEQDFIKMGFDPLFKKMFGDMNYTNKAAAVIGIFLNIPYDEVKDRVEILNNQKIKKNKNEKYQEQDVLVHVKLISGNQYVNLEANIHGYTQLLIDRNTGYVANILSRQLDKGQGYDQLEPVLQINFNEPSAEIKNQNILKPIDEYMLRNEQGRVLTDMLKIINIDVDKCYNIWYNNDMKKFTSCEQNIIKIGALHKIQDKEEFRKCLGEIEMDEEVKNKIQNDMDEYQQDKELAMVYNKKKHEEFVRRAHEIELEQKKEKLEQTEEKLKQKKEELEQKKEELEQREENIETIERKIQQEREKILEEKKEFIKNLLNEKIDINKISKITGLSIEKIKEIES